MGLPLVLSTLVSPSMLLSPMLGFFRARQASATEEKNSTGTGQQGHQPDVTVVAGLRVGHQAAGFLPQPASVPLPGQGRAEIWLRATQLITSRGLKQVTPPSQTQDAQIWETLSLPPFHYKRQWQGLSSSPSRLSQYL